VCRRIAYRTDRGHAWLPLFWRTDDFAVHGRTHFQLFAVRDGLEIPHDRKAGFGTRSTGIFAETENHVPLAARVFRVSIDPIGTSCLPSAGWRIGGLMTDSDEKGQTGGLARDIFAGMGLGGALGLIVGLSVTPVVSVLVGGLTSLLAVFLGLQGGDDAPAALKAVRLNGPRIGGFGLALAAGVLAGLFIRTTEPFTEPVALSVERWTAAGYPAERARELVVFERTGILPPDAETDAAITEQAARTRSTALFSDLANVNLCRELDPDGFGRNVSEGLYTYRIRDNETLNRLADAVEAMPEDAQMPALDMLGQLFCDLRLETQ
jgi:hypothetical protein